MDSPAQIHNPTSHPSSKRRRTQNHLGLWILVIGLALALRLHALGEIPASLFRDEAEKALNGWSLLQSGTDLENQSWPLFIKAFGVTTSAIYQYSLLAPFTIFGPTDAAARLPAALVGFLAVILVPCCLRGTTSRQLALLAALALALSPWHIPMSRWAQQGIFLPALLLLYYGGWRTLTTGHWILFPLGMAAGGLSTYTYDPARLLIPASLVVAIMLFWPSIRRYPFRFLWGMLSLTLVGLPTLWLLLTQTDAAQARFRAISILSLPLSDALALGIKNYFSHFSPDFLLFQGDRELRHGAGGVLGYLVAPGLWIGLVTSLRRGVRHRRAWLLALVILGPIPASLTREGIPHALRTLATCPFFVILALLGWRDFLGFVRRLWPTFRAIPVRAHATIAAILLLLNSGPFLYRYFGEYARSSAFSWQYGVREGLLSMKDLSARKIRIVGCSVLGGSILAQWYGLQQGRELKSGNLLQEGPFGQSPAVLDARGGGLPAAYLAIPGLDPIPGGVLLPVWYVGYGSEDGKNPTLLEIHINPAALRLLRQNEPQGAANLSSP